MMRSWIAVLAALLFCSSAVAHDIPQSTVQLDIGLQAIDAQLLLPLSELGVALQLPLAQDPESVRARFESTIRDYVLQHAKVSSPEGVGFPAQIESVGSWKSSNPNYVSNDWLMVKLRYTVPADASSAKFVLDYDVIVSSLVTHNIMASVRRDLRNGLTGEHPQMLDMLGFQHTRVVVDGSSGSWLKGFREMFAHGAAHIASGTDHLLFLIVLLLPAPLTAVAYRWVQPKGARESVWAIVKVVSGFTVGHCLTLVIAAMGWVTVPSRPIEVLIALSIFASALHAWRPIFRGREVWIAAGFGLVHGLAFASSIEGLGFDPWTLALSVLGFNLGIEAVQLAIVAVLLPILLWGSHFRAYRPIRIALAAFAAVCALGWVGERAFGTGNPLAPIVDWLTDPPVWFVALWCVLGLAAAVQILRMPPTRKSFGNSYPESP